MKFTYSSGQKPLDGYTLKRGIGRGGFGEVYFALSDGGKEVALKLVRGDNQVELRGVAHCLNLKHPNLVALYDLRKDEHGDHWVIMEYISGEPLSTVLSRHPSGVPHELVQEWFLGLARAVAYLHDHGIVHRDLKPGNIFLENGTVKVGDYGLSKSISTSGRLAQTQSVGTVHYMAPEISTGNYNKQIDTYAGGIILYEMLTGHVPFDGESCAEILMKHLTTAPDLGKVPREWSGVVTKALSKNPAHRYESMAEMARAVEALGQEPEPVAVRKARTVNPATTTELPLPSPTTLHSPLSEEVSPSGLTTGLRPMIGPREQVVELCLSLVVAVLFAGLATALWGGVGPTRPGAELSSLFYLTVAASWAILIPGKIWTKQRGDAWTRRLVMMFFGGFLGIAALWLEGWHLGDTRSLANAEAELVARWPKELVYFAFYALAFALLRWWRITDRRRPVRFSFAPVLAAGFWGVVLQLLGRPHQLSGALVLVFASIIVQLVSPWDPPPPTPTRRPIRLRYA